MRSSGLGEVKESVTLTHKLASGMVVGVWAKGDNPPLGSDKSPYYAAAFAGASGEARGRVARCLLWSDFVSNQYCLARLEAYVEAVRLYPSDERCVFYVAALCALKVIQDPEIVAYTYHHLLNPSWDKSPFWNRFALPQRNILSETARLYASLSEVTPERVDLVERALERAEDRVAEKTPLASYLARAYRANARDDEQAEIVYRYVFTYVPEDRENNVFLARLYLQRQRSDADACAVFARMVAQCEAAGNESEANYWALRLAQAYMNVGRVDEGTLAAYERAARLAPEDQDLRAALLCAVARQRVGRVPSAHVKLLEDALEDEALLQSRFTARRWDWSLVVRALGYAYGVEGRTDEEAMGVYEAATQLCPEERDLWGFYARGLALRGDFTEGAIPTYERALRSAQSDEAVSIALARAYVRCEAYQGAHRERAMGLWEQLYRQGVHWPEMVQALARAYVLEDRVNDIALTLWEKAAVEDQKNGAMRLRIAQEYRSRSEWAIAGRYYKEAAKLLPKDFVAQFEAAQLLLEHFNDYASGIRLLQKAVKLPTGQKHLQAHFLLGEALLAREKRDEAQAIFQKIVDDLDPTHTPTLLHLAKLSLKYEEESVKQAEALYEQAKTSDPDQPETYRRMAELYHEKGEYEEEEKALERYLELADPDPEKLMSLADLYIRRGEFLRAEQTLRRIIGMGKGDKKLYTLLGEVILQAQAQTAPSRAA
jgi:tetratricopeptide (TPR) repeat protein